MRKERAGESGEERERREAWGEKCVYHKKTINESKNIEYRLTG